MDMNPCNKEAFGFISINPGDSTFLMREGFCRAGRFQEHQRYGSPSRVVSERRSGSKPHKSFIREA